MNSNLSTLEHILNSNGYIFAAMGINEHLREGYAGGAVAAWRNWGKNSKIPALIQVEYD